MVYTWQRQLGKRVIVARSLQSMVTTSRYWPFMPGSDCGIYAQLPSSWKMRGGGIAKETPKHASFSLTTQTTDYSRFGSPIRVHTRVIGYPFMSYEYPSTRVPGYPFISHDPLTFMPGSDCSTLNHLLTETPMPTHQKKTRAKNAENVPACCTCFS